MLTVLFSYTKDMDKAIQQGVERAIFAPYFPYQTTYPQLEKQVLMAQLEIIKPVRRVPPPPQKISFLHVSLVCP